MPPHERPTSPLLLGPILALFALGGLLPAPAAAKDCSQTQVGLVPLDDLGPGLYQGFQGGPYPGGLNMRPAAHDAAGLAEAQQVVPRDAQGNPAPDGKIVLLSIGMSNATQEFQRFIELASLDPEVRPEVVIVDGAKGGQSAQVIVDPNAPYWNYVLSQLAQAGVTPAQVQAIWLKEANPSPSDPFPQHAITLRDQLVQIVRHLRQLFPNARLCYLASRIYAGYATTSLNPEPYAYEQGFAVKWLIEQQIQGDPSLNFDPAKGPVEAPWLAWAGYNWADGISPKSDGLVWLCDDFAADGTHPGPGAREKVAQRLLAFLETDATAKTWFRSNPGPLCGPRAGGQLYGSEAGGGNGGIAKLALGGLATVPTVAPVFVQVRDAPVSAPVVLMIGTSAIPDGQVPFLGGFLLVQPTWFVPAVADAFGKVTLPLGAVPADASLCGLELFFQAVAQDPGSPTGFDVTRGLHVVVGH